MTSSNTPNNEGGDFTKKNAERFAKIAEEIFSPIYPVIANNISRDTGISSGICIDIGAGPGHLGLAVASRNPELQVVLCDKSEEMLPIVKTHCLSAGHGDRVSVKQGEAENLPFSNNTARLVVSRGSIFFWQDQIQAINDIYRVLKPGGYAYLGGGFGNEQLQLQIRQKMQEVDPTWEQKRQKRLETQGAVHFTALMEKSKVKEYKISKEKAGLWIIFKK